jgi:hypothetical protein
MAIFLITGMNLYAQNSDAPDMALLEFLGEGVQVGKEVVDPMTWQAIEKMTGGDQDQQQQTQQVHNDGQQEHRRQDHE